MGNCSNCCFDIPLQAYNTSIFAILDLATGEHRYVDERSGFAYAASMQGASARVATEIVRQVDFSTFDADGDELSNSSIPAIGDPGYYGYSEVMPAGDYAVYGNATAFSGTATSIRFHDYTGAAFDYSTGFTSSNYSTQADGDKIWQASRSTSTVRIKAIQKGSGIVEDFTCQGATFVSASANRFGVFEQCRLPYRVTGTSAFLAGVASSEGVVGRWTIGTSPVSPDWTTQIQSYTTMRLAQFATVGSHVYAFTSRTSGSEAHLTKLLQSDGSIVWSVEVEDPSDVNGVTANASFVIVHTSTKTVAYDASGNVFREIGQSGNSSAFINGHLFMTGLDIGGSAGLFCYDETTLELKWFQSVGTITGIDSFDDAVCISYSSQILHAPARPI